MTDKTCESCNGTGWVCENHLETPAGEGADECDCGAACNCLCNPNGECDFSVVYATNDPEKVKYWSH